MGRSTTSIGPVKKLGILPKAVLAVVLQCDDQFLFLSEAEGTNAKPILLESNGITEHQIFQIEAALDARGIDPAHIHIVPMEIPLAPLLDLSIHLAIVKVSAGGLLHAKQNGLMSVSANHVARHRDTNIFFDLIARSDLIAAV